MNILQICAFAAPSPGNFMASLLALDEALTKDGHNTIYAFPERARDKDWCIELQKTTKVYFLPEAHARIKLDTYKKFKEIYKENDIDIMHSHFELYDIPATVTAPKNVKIFWHLHDPITFENGSRGVLNRIQYGIVGRKAYLISVSDFYRKEVIKRGFPQNRTQNVLNSIDLNRIDCIENRNDFNYDFLTFGWDFLRKGDDLILKACDKLLEEGYNFKILINGNEETWKKLENFSKGKTMPYLVKGEPTDNVNSLYADSGVFIQASRRETFSYAVCEAAYAGLPVISSNIPGLEWAHSVPSVDFFENEKWEDLYLLMKKYLDGYKKKDEDIITSRNIIKDNYGLDIWAKKIIEIYTK